MVIDEADLDLDEDVCLFEGQPFTGIARAFHPNGVLKRESPYVAGFEQGQCKEWYSNGQLKREWSATHGVADGNVCEWHENGKIKSIGNYSKGVELAYDEWSDVGLLIMHRELDRQSELWKYANGSNE